MRIKLVLILIAALLATYGSYMSSFETGATIFLRGDGFYYRATIVSLLEDGDLVLNNNIGMRHPMVGHLALGKSGKLDKLVPKHPILLSLAATPFYALFGTTGLLWFNLIVVLTIGVVVFLLNTRYVSDPIALGVAYLFGSGTLYLNYSYSYSPDAFSTMLFLLGLYGALSRSYWLGGIGLGLCLFAKLPNAPLVALVCLYVVWTLLSEQHTEPRNRGRSRRQLVGFLVILGLAVAPLLITNQFLFGAPWVTGYHRTVVMTGLVDHTNSFNQPLLAGLFNLLFHAEKGIVTTNPVLVSSAAGLLLIWHNRHRHELALLATLCAAQLLFFASYDYWDVSHFSNRFLMTLVSLGSVFTALLIQRLVDTASVRSFSKQRLNK